MNRAIALLLTCGIAASILVVGCSGDRSGTDLPAVLKIGILPDESKDKLAEHYEPLCRYLSETLGLKCELVYPDSYEELVATFGAGDIDLAYFGGLTFVQSAARHGAVPLVVRDVDTHFTTCFVTAAESPIRNIADCEGSVLTFGSPSSTSGHLMPRHFLMEQDIALDTFFSDILYSGAHDSTAEWVRDGKAAVGAVNSKILRAMMADGRMQEGAIRVLWETPPYSDYVWAVQSNFSRPARTKLRDAFLALSPDNEEHEEILRNMDAGGFLPADTESFSRLREIASKLELLE